MYIRALTEPSVSQNQTNTSQPVPPDLAALAWKTFLSNSLYLMFTLACSKFCLNRCPVGTLNSPVREASSNSSLMGPMPVSCLMVSLLITNNTRDRDKEIQ